MGNKIDNDAVAQYSPKTPGKSRQPGAIETEDGPLAIVLAGLTRSFLLAAKSLLSKGIVKAALRKRAFLTIGQSVGGSKAKSPGSETAGTIAPNPLISLIRRRTAVFANPVFCTDSFSKEQSAWTRSLRCLRRSHLSNLAAASSQGPGSTCGKCEPSVDIRAKTRLDASFGQSRRRKDACLGPFRRWSRCRCRAICGDRHLGTWELLVESSASKKGFTSTSHSNGNQPHVHSASTDSPHGWLRNLVWLLRIDSTDAGTRHLRLFRLGSRIGSDNAGSFGKVQTHSHNRTGNLRHDDHSSQYCLSRRRVSGSVALCCQSLLATLEAASA